MQHNFRTVIFIFMVFIFSIGMSTQSGNDKGTDEILEIDNSKLIESNLRKLEHYTFDIRNLMEKYRKQKNAYYFDQPYMEKVLKDYAPMKEGVAQLPSEIKSHPQMREAISKFEQAYNDLKGESLKSAMKNRGCFSGGLVGTSNLKLRPKKLYRKFLLNSAQFRKTFIKE